MNTEKIKQAKTNDEMFTAMEDFMVNHAPLEKEIEISDLSTMQGKVTYIIKYLKRVIETARFADSNGFVVVFKDNSFTQFKKYEYGNN